MTRRPTILAAAALLLTAAEPSQGAPPAGIPPPGASSCSGCHGATAPPAVLQGRTQADLTAALDAYRNDTRPATVMNRIAKGFTQDESVAIATWLAAQK